MVYNPTIHHRRSTRIKNFDYSGKGNYFVTICCERRRPLFGEIVNGEMKLNAAGEIVRQCWLDIPNHFPHVVLEEFVIMPDHVHGLIRIMNTEMDNPDLKNGFQKMIPKSLGSIVKGFKIGVTKWFREQGNQEKIWLRNYHSLTVNDGEDLERINQYIRDNPKNWKNHPKG